MDQFSGVRSRALELKDLDPNGDPLRLERWLECIGWAIAMSPREGIASMASWMEDEFTKRFSKNKAFAYTRTYAGMATFPIAEVLPRFSVLPAAVGRVISTNHINRWSPPFCHQRLRKVQLSP